MKILYRDGTPAPGGEGQEKTIRRLYGNSLGRILVRFLTARWISRLAGRFLSSGISKGFIKGFIKNNNIDMTQFEPGPYQSYNEFFSRRILPEARPMDMEETHFMSPCDCKLTVLPITEGCLLTLKHTVYTVESLLQDEALAKRYQGGWAFIFRLCVEDYHRYHYAFSGEKSRQVRLPGRLHTVNPIANDVYPIYKENAREYCTVTNAVFGTAVVMEVGALMVGRIVNPQQGEASVQRGQEKGYFQFGGSTVVMLLEKDRVLPDAVILSHSRKGCETVVRLGETIGLAKE